MNLADTDKQRLLQRARLAIKRGDRRSARRCAQFVLKYDAHCEDAWLILAALASPRASIYYLKKALEINPQSTRARKGMQWAVQRLSRLKPSHFPPPTKHDKKRSALTGLQRWEWILAALSFISLILIAGSGSLILLSEFIPRRLQEPLQVSGVYLEKITLTPTATSTPTQTSTFTPTITPTDTATPTATFSPTPTFTNSPSPTVSPTFVKKKKNGPAPRPDVVGITERWIDVDLSSQHVYAMEGDALIQTFLVSTGTWQHPTITGLFRIYVKYRSTHMSGPGYFLPNVPYVMYFYKGYALHGTYWHNNFGTPMSHGCVNLRIEDAKWLYQWAAVGTVVNIHP